ncbi:hypothetical protein BH10PSE12_BH10PSE12_18900 [soil metagenome]
MSVAQNITKHFGGDWRGNEGFIPTPGHSAKDRGTTVRDADNGDVVFHSFNGADWRDLKDECRAKGLLPEREVSRHSDAKPAQWRVTGIYEYADAEGIVRYRTVRKEHAGERKRFVAQRPDGNGGWLSGLGDVPRLLYRLPDIHTAINRSVLKDDALPTIYLVEGERKADKLASWGLTATAVAFGCKGWRPEYADALAGCTVVILPDNDDEGRGFADTVSKSIESVGGKPKIVELPGLPPKGDVMDWAGTSDDLEKLVEGAVNAPRPTFEIADLGLWARTTPTPKAFVMAPYIPREDVIIVTGDGGTNKSTFALQMSACAAVGKQMLGMDVQPGPALYVTAEDDNRENHWRLAKMAGAIGTTLDSLNGRLHIVSLRGRLNNELATFDHDGKLRPAPAYALLRATIEQTGAKLVTLDNVAHLFAGNENDRSQVTAFINLLYQLCGDFGVTILLIAHRNKTGDSYSGSTAWLNAVRSQVLLERSDEDPDVRRLSLGKANYARAGEEMSFRWHDFALIRDQDLSPTIAAQIAAVAADNASNSRFLVCLAAATKQGRAVSHINGSNYAPKTFAGMTEAGGMKQMQFAKAMERLLHLDQIRLNQPLWQDASRHWKQGIKLASECGDPPAVTPCGDLREPLNQVIENVAATPRAGTPIYINISGAAPEAAAPLREIGRSAGLGRPIFAADGSINRREDVDFPADDSDQNPAWDAEPYQGKL